mgnify:CR=1 FL=1
MKTVSRSQVGQEELALPPRVQEALGELVGSAKEGLLALSVGVGLGVLAELLEAEKQFRKVIGYRDLAKLALAVEREISGPKGRPSAAARRWPSLRPEVVG